MNQQQITLIVNKIKQKRELSGLADSFVASETLSYLKKHNISSISSEKSEKLIIKAIRNILRKHSGRFGVRKESIGIEMHPSTQERAHDYPLLKQIIENLRPESVLDLGCGINPIALAKPGVYYYSYDIDEQSLGIVENFFRSNNLAGKVFTADLRTHRDFPEADLALLLKVVDLLDKKGHKISEELMKCLKCKHLIVSFSTKTLSGKPMNHPQRGWIERLCARLGYKYSLHKGKNELFYLIEKN